MSAKSTIDNLERGIQKLIEENRRLKGENGRLGSRGEKLREENDRLRGELEARRREGSVKSMARDLASTQQVDRLIKEVDECLELLNKEA